MIEMSSSPTNDEQPTRRDSVASASSQDEDYSEELECEADFQDVEGMNINPAKLTAMLRSKFGVGAYEVHVSKVLFLQTVWMVADALF